MHNQMGHPERVEGQRPALEAAVHNQMGPQFLEAIQRGLQAIIQAAFRGVPPPQPPALEAAVHNQMGPQHNQDQAPALEAAVHNQMGPQIQDPPPAAAGNGKY